MDCATKAAEAESMANLGRRASANDLAPLRACLDRERQPAAQTSLARAYVRALRDEDLPAAARELLHHDSSFVRDAVAGALVDAQSPAAFEALRGLADDREREVRWYAYEALASDPERLTRIDDALDLLARGLRDDDFSIRWVAANGLLRIGAAAIVPVLRALVRERPMPAFHEAARRVLGRVEASEPLAPELARLVDSLGHGTTDVQSPPIAQSILEGIFGIRESLPDGV
jgi:HEAT repeat protein